jgi:predicted dienelactone hydrolase
MIRPLLPRLAIACASLLAGTTALAADAGFRTTTVAATAEGGAAIPLALYYPTQGTERTVPMGPFSVNAVMSGAPAAQFKGLIVVSHGTGGTELGHGRLAEALARHGYLVAALRHPGDNWQDRSLLMQSGGTTYFNERPRQVSRVIDALLADPEWRTRIATDARGPRVGALGHSAGGYTVLALAGGRPDVARIVAHCAAERAEDPIFCSMGRAQPPGAPVTPPAAPVSLRDARVRSVAAMSPVGAVFTADSLAAVTVPAAVYAAALDRFLVPRFHAEWIARNLPGARYRPVPNAWHFAFMDTPSMPIGSEDGDLGADPPGFDRAAYLRRLGEELCAFFDDTLR